MKEVVVIIVVTVVLFLAIFLWIKFQKKKRDKKLLQTVTTINRGTSSERNTILMLLKNGVSPQALFHDIYVEKSNGEFSQIDIVVVTKVGIIVIEDKCFKGLIQGNGNKDEWVQVVTYNNGREKSHKFYNPVKQNDWHITYLRQFLTESVPFYSVVSFSGDCKLGKISNIGNDTFVISSKKLLKTIDIIMRNEHIEYKNIQGVLSLLRQAMNNGEDISVREQHSADVSFKFGKKRNKRNARG